ncbi:MAG: hypothetical protein PW788_00535 [Micavibrio sp.]|nr:hypothetical protein [Micavibrio sp.]
MGQFKDPTTERNGSKRMRREPSLKDIDLGDNAELVNSEVYEMGDSEIDREFEQTYMDRDDMDAGLHAAGENLQDLRPDLTRLEETGDVHVMGKVAERNLTGTGPGGVLWGRDGDESRFAEERYKRSADRWHEDEYEVDRDGRP